MRNLKALQLHFSSKYEQYSYQTLENWNFNVFKLKLNIRKTHNTSTTLKKTSYELRSFKQYQQASLSKNKAFLITASNNRVVCKYVKCVVCVLVATWTSGSPRVPLHYLVVLRSLSNNPDSSRTLGGWISVDVANLLKCVSVFWTEVDVGIRFLKFSILDLDII